ncbi:MAG: type IV pili twitching motility protein PilT, partial [Vicinamibacteria bacterium]|nr:type IV pili twitching motility protein PilT [Vicinamibacteria bacterium]
MAMPELERLLRKMIEGGASDLHLVVGRPPLLRNRGELVPMDEPVLTRESSEAIITAVLAPGQRDRIFENLDLDFAY